MSSIVSASQVVTGQVQSLDSVRAHALPSDAMIFASATKVQPANQNPGSYAINDQVSGSTPTINGSVPAVTLSPFADLYKEGSVFIDGVAADYISTALTGYTMSQGISMEMFVNYVNFTNSTYTIGFMAPSAATYNFTLGVNGSGVPIVTWTGGTLTASSGISSNTWNHLACAWNGSVLQLFVNGVYNNGTASFTPPTLAQNFLVGRANSLTCTAYVTDVRIVTNPAVYYSSGSFGSFAFTVPSAPLSPAAAGTTNFMLRVGQNSPTIQSGALTFDRGLKQYMNFGPQTFNVVTQGFTAIWRGQFTGTAGNYERIFEFLASSASSLNGANSNTIFLTRNATGTSLYFGIQPLNNSATPTAYAVVAGTLSQNVPYVVAARYSPVTQLLDLWVNGIFQGSVAATTAQLGGDRILGFTTMGYESQGAVSPFTSMTSNTLAIYNRALSNVEIINAYSALTTATTNAPIEIGDSNGTPALSIAGDGRVNVTKLGQTSNVLPWPPAAMTGYVTSINGGNYVASDSSEFNATLFGAWQAFDKNPSYQWSSGQPLYSTSAPYSYTGTVTTSDVNGTVYPGEWLQIQLPSSVTVSSYSIYGASGSNQMPGKWVVLGSRDGVNWFLVDSQKTTILSTVTGFSSFSVSSTQAYSYYRVVTNQISGNSTYQCATILDLVLYGTADTAQTLTVAQPMTLSYGAQTASLTGISGDKYVPQDFSSSGLNVPAYVVSNTATVANTVQYSSFGPFAGEGSLYFQGGPGAYVNFPSSAVTLWPGGATSLGSGTIEMWVYLTKYNANQTTLIARGVVVSGTFEWWLNISSSGVLSFQTFGGAFVTSGGTVTLNAWNHVAVSAASNYVSIFLNGTLVGTPFTYSGTLTGSASDPILISNPSNANYTINGYVANIRLTQGQALYTTSFTPPTAPLQPIQGTTQAGTPYGTVLLLRNAPAPGRVLTSKFGGANSGSVLSFPPAAMTTYGTTLNSGYGQGTYVASASSEYSTLFVWYAFDKNTATPWGSNGTYNSSAPYSYAGTVTMTDVNGTSYSGEWLQIQMPSSIVLANYSITPGSTNYQYQGPSKFWIFGSRDGVTWSLVDSRTGVAWPSNGVQNFSVQSSQAFTYFRILTNQLNGYAAGIAQVVVISEWVLNGTIEGPNVTADGRLGVGVSAPTQALEVAGTSVVYGDLVSNGSKNYVRWVSTNGTAFPQGQATNRYYKIATLSATGDGGGGARLMIRGYLNPGGLGQGIQIDSYVQTRTGLIYGGISIGRSTDVTSRVDILIYLESNSTYSIYLKTYFYFTFDLAITGETAIQGGLTVFPCPSSDNSIAAPTGTLQSPSVVVASNTITTTSTGLVGIGATPGAKLDVYGVGDSNIRNYATADSAIITETVNDTSYAYVQFRSNTNGTPKYTWLTLKNSAGSNQFWVCANNGYTTGVYLNQNATAWSASSDARLKTIIEPISNAVAKVDQINPCIYSLKSDDTHARRVGVIAQEVYDVLPEAVDSTPDSEQMMGVQYSSLVPLALAAIKELSARVAELEQRLASAP